MKLESLFEFDAMHKVYGYFIPSQGPNRTPGVSLHYVEPHEESLAKFLPDARTPDQEKRLHQMYDKPGFTTPQLGWWVSEEDYYEGKSDFHGSREKIEHEMPNLVIVGSKEEAVRKSGY